MVLKFLGSCFLAVHATSFCSQQVAIIGLGGRSQWLLQECLKEKPDIRVVAICDDNAQSCIDYHSQQLAQKQQGLCELYQQSIRNAVLYPNTSEGLHQLCTQHKDIDTIFVTSANYDHFWHLNGVLASSAVKNIFMEKPLFKTLDEFNRFDFNQTQERNVTIGLTLRYSSMARIVAEQLRAHHAQLGALQHVHIWERLSFSHAFTAFVMGPWRRYKSTSGGLMLEKVIHDLDLALYFTQALQADPRKITLRTQADHRFFIKSRMQELLEYITRDDAFRQKLEARVKSWAKINLIRAAGAEVDWQATLDTIFAPYPLDDNFADSDLIPDYQKLTASMDTAQGATVGLELEVDMAGFRTATERGQRFTFQHGQAHVDVMASSLHVQLDDGQQYEYDLLTNGSDHADGDEHIIHTIIGKPLPAGHSMAMLNDPTVKLANLLVLISEHQADHGPEQVVIEKCGQEWVAAPTALW